MSKKDRVLSVAVSGEKLQEIDDIISKLPFRISRSQFAEPFINEGIARVSANLELGQPIDSIDSIRRIV
jgi:hypothetical protein